MDTSKKIIRGIVNSRGFTITSAITQWDYGWQFIPEIEDLPATYRLDFSNEEKRGTALPVYCSTDGAEVPTELIDTGKDVWVWFVRIGEDYGITEYKWRIPNKCKPKTEEDEPTPTQQSSIDQLIVRSNEAVTSAEQSASEAGQSAQSAHGYAEQAETARDAAQGYATQAQTSANSASTSASQASASATASANSASASAQIKADIEDLVDDAQGYANASAQSASASATSATQAQGFAQSASASAQSASGYASSAQTSANTASAKAQDASGYASTASQKATESAQSASQASQSAQTAEQAKTASQTAQGLAESARDSAVSAKTDAESARDDAVQAKEDAESAVASISGALDDKAPIITDTASGSIASFPDGADGIPLKSLIVNIDPVQDLSQGDPSPENICPISGWTQVGVEQSGVNVWDEEWEVGGINSSGSNTTERDRIRAKNYCSCLPSTSYYVRCALNTDELKMVYYAKDKTFISVSNWLYNGAVTTPANAYYLRVFTSSVYGNVYNHDISINYPSTDHEYHPYTGRSITIDLGQTVYGGKLDVVSGELVIDKAMDVYDGTTKTVTTVAQSSISGNYFARTFLTAKSKDTIITAIGRAISNRLKEGTTPTAQGDFSIISNGQEIVFVINDQTITTKSAFDAYLQSNPIQVCYELATPIEIQLSPNQINSLLGVNNIWADSGDTEVEYRADTKAYIAKKIAEALASLT